MTLIIAAKGEKYIVVGADGRGVIEDESHNRSVTNFHEKLIKLNEHNCVLISGDAEKGTYLTEKFKNLVKSDDDIDKILEKFSAFCQKQFKIVYKTVRPEAQPDIVFILAGFTKEDRKKESEPRIYILRSYDYFTLGETKNYVIDGKRIIAEYLFFKKPYDTNLSQKDMVELVFNSLYDTEKFDGDVGGTYIIKSITGWGFGDFDTEQMKTDADNEEDNEEFRKIIEES